MMLSSSKKRGINKALQVIYDILKKNQDED